MAALDLRHIDEAGSAAHQRAPGEVEPRDRLKAALVERSRAISNPPATFEERTDRRMGFEALELLERIQERVAIIEPDHQSDHHLAIFEMIEKRATVSLGIERPTDRVDHEPRLVPIG